MGFLASLSTGRWSHSLPMDSAMTATVSGVMGFSPAHLSTTQKLQQRQ